MDNEFCRRIARKIRKLGGSPKVAAMYSRFFWIAMLSVSGIMVTGMNRKGVKCLGEETPCSLRHRLTGFRAPIIRTAGAEVIIAGPAAEDLGPAPFRIHRH